MNGEHPGDVFFYGRIRKEKYIYKKSSNEYT